MDNKIDIDYLIKTRDHILFSELVAANKNVKNIEIIDDGKRIAFNYCGRFFLKANTKIKTSLFLTEIEDNIDDMYCATFITLALDSSNICRQRLKQKSYDKFLLTTIDFESLFTFLLTALNIIIIENDLGIMVKYTDIHHLMNHEKNGKPL